MLRFGEIVFGPIHSRRLGASLGVNLLPLGGKLCNFDCIYCECGFNADGRTSDAMPTAEAVRMALEEKLIKLRDEGEHIDSITFSGHGEATLNPEFPEIVRATKDLRDKYFPGTLISVLSNATTLDNPKVLEAMKLVDNAILKLDAASDELLRSIDRPNGNFAVADAVRGMLAMDGNFVIQTMLMCGARPDFSKDARALEEWMTLVRKVHPRQVMVYTLDRPAPTKGLSKMSVELMTSLLRPLVDEGFDIQING